MKVQFLLISCIIIATEASRATYPVFSCSLNEKGECKFKNVQLTQNSPKFQPTVSNVVGIHLGGEFGNGGSRMHTFTSDICYAYPHVKSINADYLGIQEFGYEAFNDCQDLEELKFSYNNLKSLTNADLFLYNKKLKVLHFYAHPFLTTINPRVFDPLSQLVELSFGSCALLHFPIEEFSYLMRLERLYIGSNKLTDINATGIMMKFPNLKYVHLCPNNGISAGRMRDIITYFKARGVNTNEKDC